MVPNRDYKWSYFSANVEPVKKYLCQGDFGEKDFISGLYLGVDYEQLYSTHSWVTEEALLSSHGRGIKPQDASKKNSRGLSRGVAGNSGFPRLVPMTSGSLAGFL